MPCGDVPGCVHIGVAGEGACCAPKEGLALARLPVQVPTCAAALACERGIDLLDPSRSLVAQAASEQPPSRSEDLPVEPSLLAHTLAGILNSADSRTGHVCDLKVLKADHIEPARQISADFLAPVPASIDLSGVESRNGMSGSDTAVAAWFCTGQFAVQQPQTPLPRCAQPRNAQHFTGGQRNSHCHTAIDTNNFARIRARDGLGDRSESYMPPTGTVQRHPERLHTCRDRTGPAEPHPTAFRDQYVPRSPVQSADALRVQCDDAEAFAPPGLAPPGFAVCASEEVPHSLSEIAKRLLLHHLAASSEPSVFRPGGGELPALLQVAGRARPTGTPPRLLLTGKVPHEPRMGAMPSQHYFLGIRRQQAVARHTKTLSITADNPEGLKT